MHRIELVGPGFSQVLLFQVFVVMLNNILSLDVHQHHALGERFISQWDENIRGSNYFVRS
jgi:hypothetical protein